MLENMVDKKTIEWYTYKSGKSRKVSVKPLSKKELSYLNKFLEGKVDSNPNKLYKIGNRIYAESIAFNKLRNINTDPLKREPPFVLLGTADLGLYKSEPLEAVLSQISTEEGYGNKLGELLYRSKVNKMPCLSPQKSIFAISARKIEENAAEYDSDWHKAELKETRGLNEVSFAALISAKSIGLPFHLLIILLGITDGVTKDGIIVEVTKRGHTFKTIVKKQINEEKITQVNIYSVLLGAKKWRCVFYCQDGRFVIEGKPDIDKALNDIKKGAEARVTFKLSKDPVYSNFSENFGWPIYGKEYDMLLEGIKNEEFGFVNSMNKLSDLRKYGFSISNIYAIYKLGINSIDQINLQNLQTAESTIKNSLSKMIFQQALCKWAGENNISYLDIDLLKRAISDKVVFYDIEYYNQMVILYGFSEKGETIQFDAKDAGKLIKYLGDRLNSGNMFVSYGNNDKNYIINLLKESSQDFLASEFKSKQVDISNIFLRGYALKTRTKGLYDVAYALAPKEFKKDVNILDILELVNEYIYLRDSSKDYSDVFNRIKIKNKNDLVLLESIYKKLKELYLKHK